MALRDDPDRLFRSKLLQAACAPLSALYGLGLALRPAPSPEPTGRKVVSIGNLHVGGTGKTPVVIALAAALRDAGRKVAVVSRGYRGRLSGEGAAVAPGSRAADVGDEPLEIARALGDVPVHIGADRLEACRRAGSEADVLILDDGFQHARVARDIDVVVIPAAAKPSRQRLLPWGRLREPIAALARCHAIVRVREFGDDDAEVSTEWRHHTDAPVFFARRVVAGVVPYPGTVVATALLGGKVVALSGIANPRRFHRAIESAGARVVEEIVRPDHHVFTDGDLALVARLVEAHDGLAVMTAKDAARLDGRPLPFPAAVLTTAVECPGLVDFVKARL